MQNFSFIITMNLIGTIYSQVYSICLGAVGEGLDCEVVGGMGVGVFRCVFHKVKLHKTLL